MSLPSQAFTPPDQQWQSYIPLLMGTTDQPSAVAYVTQLGRFRMVNRVVQFKYKLVTSSIVKSTLTDLLLVSLPMPAAASDGTPFNFSARVENSLPVLNANQGEIVAGQSYAQMRSIPQSTASALLTYALLSLGSLVGTITFTGAGHYEI